MDRGSWEFSMLFKLGMMFGWQIQPSESGDCGMHMRSLAFVRHIRCAVSLVIRRRVSSLLCVVQKKRLWGLWSHAHGMVRPQYASGSRSVQRRQPHLSRVRSAPRAVQELWPSEARAFGVSGRQPLLYQAFCFLRGAALPQCHDQGCCQGIGLGLAWGQGTRNAVHARADCESGC